MTVPAQRFKFLDNETNVPIADINSLHDNAVYTEPEQQNEDTSIFPEISSENLKMLKSSLATLAELQRKKINLDTIVAGIIKDITGPFIPKTQLDLIRRLQELDPTGLSYFIKDVSDLGKSARCFNLQFLNIFNLKFRFDKNILLGQLNSLLLSWINRICSGQLTKNFLDKSSNKDKIEQLLPYTLTYDPADTYKQFKKCYRDLISSRAVTQPTLPDIDSFINTNITLPISTIRYNLSSLKQLDVTTDYKTQFINNITVRLNNTIQTDIVYSKLLYIKGEVSKLPLYGTSTSSNSIQYEYLNDYAGRLIKKLHTVDFSSYNDLSMETIDRQIYAKLKTFQLYVISEKLYSDRSTKTGSFKDIDFYSLFIWKIPLTDTEKSWLLVTNKTSSSHRWNDTPTTSYSFI